jgi:guanylate kinase
LSERPLLVFVVSAPSGAGKTTVLERLMAEVSCLRFSVSHTTRLPREGERDGVQYHFVTREQFSALRERGSLLESAEVHGNLYGTCLSEIERAHREGCDVLLDIDVQGAALVRARVPGAISVFILPPSYEILERRLRGRGLDDEATVRRRLAAAGREIEAFENYDYAIFNDELGACVEDLKGIVRAARCRVAMVAARARATLKSYEAARTKEPETA